MSKGRPGAPAGGTDPGGGTGADPFLSPSAAASQAAEVAIRATSDAFAPPVHDARPSEIQADACGPPMASPMQCEASVRDLLRKRQGVTLLRKARVLSGDYGNWRVAPEHHGTELWIVAEPPQVLRFRNPRGEIAEGLVYRRADGLVARAEYLELTPELCAVDHAHADRLVS